MAARHSLSLPKFHLTHMNDLSFYKIIAFIWQTCYFRLDLGKARSRTVKCKYCIVISLILNKITSSV